MNNNKTVLNTSILEKNIEMYVLQPTKAVYIERWQKKVFQNDKLKEVTKVDNERIRHFSMPICN